MIIFDGHNDTITKLFSEPKGKQSFLKLNKLTHLDLIKAKKGGFNGGIFSIFPPTPKSSLEFSPMFGFSYDKNGYKQSLRSPVGYKYASSFTDQVVDFLLNTIKSSNGKMKLILNYADFEASTKQNQIAVLLHFEGAEAIRTDLSNLEKYYNLGLRALGLVWSRPNDFGCGVNFEFPHTPDTGEGLTKYGKELVKACNKLGIIIDLAHITEKGFWDVAKLSTKPLVVSHTNVHSICPSTRNITDKQIDAIKDSNGIIGINFEPINSSLSVKDFKDLSFENILEKLNNSSLDSIITHINYIAKRIGVDYIGFGSDFDGADMPMDLKDASELHNLIKKLKGCGYSDDEIDKITYKNWFRVIRDTFVD